MPDSSSEEPAADPTPVDGAPLEVMVQEASDDIAESINVAVKVGCCCIHTGSDYGIYIDKECKRKVAFYSHEFGYIPTLSETECKKNPSPQFNTYIKRANGDCEISSYRSTTRCEWKADVSTCDELREVN